MISQGPAGRPKIEFILAQHPWMENDCQLADLVLPTHTMLEVR